MPFVKKLLPQNCTMLYEKNGLLLIKPEDPWKNQEVEPGANNLKPGPEETS